MKPEAVKDQLGDLPHMTFQQGRTLWEFLRENSFKDCLELGFFHGTSSAYLAAALHEMGEGKLTCIDLAYVRGLEPSIEDILGKLGLRDYVDCYFEEASYIWRLMRFLEQDPQPRFDFCYIDGAHTWAVDGFAFLLVERLLRPGGWIVFDDLNWSFGTHLATADPEELKKQLPADLVESMFRMPDEEKETAQIRQVYELLVKPHPAFNEFRDEGGWAWARKSQNGAGHSTEVRREIVTVRAASPSGGIRTWLRRKLSG